MSVKSDGFDEAIKDLSGLGEGLRRGIARDAIVIGAPLVAQAQVYGPELPNQRYQRTYTLRDGWRDSQPQVTASGDSVTISHANPVAYAEDVQGVGVQEIWFEGRWDDLQTVADKAAPVVGDQVALSVAETLRGMF